MASTWTLTPLRIYISNMPSFPTEKNTDNNKSKILMQGRIQDCTKGGSVIINAREISEATPTFTWTTPIFDRRPHV